MDAAIGAAEAADRQREVVGVVAYTSETLLPVLRLQRQL
jgi:hypothetical protein